METRCSVVIFSWIKKLPISGNDAERWALGSAYRIVHCHANKAISFLTTADYYNDAMQMTREYAQLNKGVPVPPKVKMNKENVPTLQKHLYEVSQPSKIFLSFLS